MGTVGLAAVIVPPLALGQNKFWWTAALLVGVTRS